jgi:nitrogen PTS system EIIA component
MLDLRARCGFIPGNERPRMPLTLRDIAKYFAVPEKTVLRWVKKDGLPASCVNEQYLFNRSEVFEWGTSRRMNIPPEIVRAEKARESKTPSLSEALQNGGVFHGVTGRDKSNALREIIGRLKLPSGTDQDSLLRVFLAREELASTAVGDGIAIPHVRTPVVLHVEKPRLALCFLENPVDFSALDGKPVYALFTLICPTIKSHLHLLSRLAFVLRDPGFKDAVRRRANLEEILAQITRVEGNLNREGES